MSKVAAYLQEHILGEVSTNAAVRKAMSTDASVLEIMPEIVIYPRVTNDIRKVARFAWQLAEKGHVMGLTARGGGTDQTGAAIGAGASIALPAHMNRVCEFDSKQKLIRVQPGLNAAALSEALALHGMSIPAMPVSAQYSTIGGAVANNASGYLSGSYGEMRAWVHQVEAVLANGDVLQTQRLSKRDLNKKKGLQTFEGEIYRTIDNLIDDNAAMMAAKLSDDVRDNVGYTAITQVRRKDGSFDLTPLFVGSQGTLGIISELILKTQFVSNERSVVAATFETKETARDAIEQLRATTPAFLEYYDGALFTIAAASGRSYDICKANDTPVGAVVLVGYDEFNEHLRQRKAKRAEKILQASASAVERKSGAEAVELLALRDVTSFGVVPAGKDNTAPSLVDGAYVPFARSEDFTAAVQALADKHRVELPLHARMIENTYYTRPVLQLQKVGDKQKIFKLLDDYTKIVDAHGGHLIGEAGEGRVKTRFAHAQLDEEVLALFAGVKAAFDPHGILNPGVKQSVEL
ncbi:MAG: FAD-binding oxidoreductase, partial [Candidatus Saccharimonadales bacterium]